MSTVKLHEEFLFIYVTVITNILIISVEINILSTF